MLAEWTVYAFLALGVASLLVAGVFQAFSDFVMRSLAAARPASGVEAMQMINREVFGSAFLALLLGLAPASLLAALYALLSLGGSASGWVLAGAAIYLLAVILVTVAGNVPMNMRLDRMAPGAAETEAYWRVYVRRWTRLNHVRTIGSLAAALCFLSAGMALA